MKSFSPAEGLVSVNRYTVYATIPGLDTYVAAKLDKKKFTLIYTMVFIAAIMLYAGITTYAMLNETEFDSIQDKTERAEMIYEKYSPQITFAIIISLGVHFPIYIYLVRKWAKEWNAKFQ